MQNFTYWNPVKVVFGKGTISQLDELLTKDEKILMTYGGGSIMKNGVYEQVRKAAGKRKMIEFGGIEPNPKYETLMKAAELGKKEKVGLLLSVGGGSVLDGTKFIAAAIRYKGGDPWDILAKSAEVKDAVPLGAVLTLPATGSEMNSFAVISRVSTNQKLAFGSPLLYPRFSVLDPETTMTLPRRQTQNGVVDSFVHVVEQYLTKDVNTPLQDRMAESVLETLVEQGRLVLKRPNDYGVRANLMWCSTMALNGIIGCGTVEDWATHMIGHEITALTNMDHARTLAVVLPGLLRYCKKGKKAKLAQFAKRVWKAQGIAEGKLADFAIERTVDFFHEMGMHCSASEAGLSKEIVAEVAERIGQGGQKLGEARNIGRDSVLKILL